MRARQLILVTGSGSGVGKTSLGTALVERLSRLGFRVGVVKHVHHGVDYRVKDTGRYLDAGASRVAAIGPGEYMIVEKKLLGFWNAIDVVGDVDVVVVEGFKNHMGNVAGRGGCIVYVGREDDKPPSPSSGKLIAINPAEIGEAVEALIRLIEEGKCVISTQH